MRPSRVLAKLRAGEVVSCFKLNLADARAVEIVAAWPGSTACGSDMEHVPNDWSVIEKGIWAAKSRNMDVMVRVARGSYSDHVRPLEMDAAGIMVPHVMGLADAQAVVRMTRFHPIGRRPVDGGNADGAYCGIDFVSTCAVERAAVRGRPDRGPGAAGGTGRHCGAAGDRHAVLRSRRFQPRASAHPATGTIRG